MKITSVDIFLLRHVGEEFSPFPFRPAVCRVNTDEGICGYGEAGISVGTGENGVAYMLKDLSQLVLGKDPMNNEVIWEDIHNVLRGHLSGGGVTVYSAMSALDTAMMDIKGKKLGVPIYVLLGGKHRDKLKCYLSQCHLGYLDDYRLQATIQQLADTCAKIQKDGYPAVKFNAVAFDEQAKPLPREMTTGPLEKTILDLTNCGGLSEAKKICDLAHIYDVRVQCHVAGTPIAEAAAIQLEAAIPNFYIHETYHMAAHPDCVSYGKYAYVPENGYLTVPDLPGLGQELSDKAMAESLGHIEVR